MKKLRLVGMALLAILMCMNFASCSDDETISRIEIAEGLALDVFIGESKQLNVKHYPEYLEAPDYVWSSSNPSVIGMYINTGEYTAKSVGKSIITVTAIDLQLSAQCEITVKAIETTGISISPKEKEMFIGEELTLTVTFTPENATYKDLRWSSSDSNIATVNNDGKVTAIKEGECIIFAKTENEKTAECKIIVKPIEVENIKLDIEEKTLEEGEEFTLTATITPETATYKDIEWSSSDSNIATIDNQGKVTAIKEGECSIYAKSTNGKTAECKIIVKPISVQKVEFVSTEIKLLIGDTKKISIGNTKTEIIVTPSNAKITDVKWKIEDESIASITEDGTITCKNIGTTKLTVTINGEHTAECQIIGCNIDGLISLEFGSSSTMNINGYVTGSIGCYIVNNSSQDIIAKSIQLIDSATGAKGNIMELGNEIVKANSSIGYSITIKIAYYKPIFRWTYIHNEKEYTIEKKWK